MNGYGKSDRPVVPAKPPNKTAVAEERGLAKGNAASETRPGRSAGQDVPNGLDRVRRIAETDKEARFTALMHHVSPERLWMACRDLSPKASPGVDGVMREDYGQDLVANLRDLHDRVHSGRYRARPSRRAYIPKADGRLRPLGIATVTSYCPSCSRVPECSGLVVVRPCGRICWYEHGKWCRHFRGRAQRRRGLVRRAAGLRCPDVAMRSRQAAWMRSFQGIQSRFPGPRRASSCPAWIQ
jgi:hypothetical protein